MEDVERAIQDASVELIEDLTEDESVKDEGLVFVIKLNPGGFVGWGVKAEDLLPTEVEDKDDDQLIDGLAYDHLPHVQADQIRRLVIRLPGERFPCCWVRR